MESKHGKRGFFRKFWWVFIVAPLVCALGVVATLVYVYLHLQLPERLPPIQSSYVYANDGRTLLATFHGAVDRTVIPFDQMPITLREAVIAVEDHGFYQHPAVDPIGIARAAWTDLIEHRVVQGGSTITQQLVKNVYAGQYVRNPDGSYTYKVPERTIGQKIREALLAIKLENTLSKDQIIATYLNTIYFGHGAYGVEAAAKTYFGIDASGLNVWQSATLAGLISSPSYYDPYANPRGATSRRNYALAQMAKYGYLQQDLASKLTGRGIGILSRDPEAKVFRSPYHSEYFVQYAKHELIRRYGEAGVFGGGYRVTTSLDPDLQQAAWQAVRDHLPNPHDPEGALVAIDPQTGDIRAMIGGRSFRRSQVNLATSGMKGFAGSGRQAGSAFKAFTLVAAMREHYDLNSWWNGPASITIPDRRCYSNGKPWAPVNASDSEAGTFTLERATWFSVNTVFAQLAVQVGPDKVREAAWDLGIRSKLGAPGPAPCSITLGVEPVAPLEMTNAYATLAANGVRHFATPIEKVSDRRGAPIADLTGSTRARSRAMTVLDENDAALVTKALTGVVKYGTGTAAQIPGHDVAGKTGTAQNYVDAWFCGYTPQLVTCVWVGYPKNDRTPLVDVEGVPEVYGGTIPAAIWHDFMSVALENVRNIPFPAPTSTNGYTVGPSTAAPAPSSPSPSASESASPSPSPSPRRSPSASPSTSPSATASPTTSPAVRVRSHVR